MSQQEQARSDLSVEALCEALDVSASGYYAWCGREVSPRQPADARLGDEIERVMRQRGLRSVRTRQRRVGLTKAGQSAYLTPNLFEQDFDAGQLNRKWVTDTTYIPTREGWLYLVSLLNRLVASVLRQNQANLKQRGEPASGAAASMPQMSSAQG